MISLPVALAVLAAAFLHAGWNFLVKAAPDRLVDTVGQALGASLIAACLLPFVPVPAAASWPWMTTTLVLHVAYFLLLVGSYQRADFSLAYPLMRGTAPLLVAGASPWLGEPVHAGLLVGVVLVGAGILVPAVAGLRAGAVRGDGLILAFANSTIIAAYTVCDGFGIRAAGNPGAYVVWLFFLNAWGIAAVALWRRGPGMAVGLLQRSGSTLLGAAMSIGAYGIVLWAMTQAPIAAVAALRETSVIFGALLGALVLRESMGRARVLGACAVGVGIMVVKITP